MSRQPIAQEPSSGVGPPSYSAFMAPTSSNCSQSVNNVNNNGTPLRYAVNPLPNEPALSQIRAGLGPTRKTSPYSSGLDISTIQLKSDRPGPKHKDTLQKIRDQLKPFQTPGNTDTISSESSSGTVSDVCPTDSEYETVLLNSVVGLGFDREDAYCALKLTNWRDINSATELLRKTGRCMQAELYGRGGRLENGCTSDSSRSNSPRIPSPCVVPITTIPNRTPSPLAKSAIHIIPQSSMLPTAVTVRTGQTGVNNNAGLPPLVKKPSRAESIFTTNCTVGPSDYMLQQSYLPIMQQANSKKVLKPQPQDAISPTVISIKSGPMSQPASVNPMHEPQDSDTPPTSIFHAHFDSDRTGGVKIAIEPKLMADGRCNNYQLETTNAKFTIEAHGSAMSNEPSPSLPPGIHRIVVGDDHPATFIQTRVPGGDGYITHLLSRVEEVLGPKGKRDSTASSAGSESGVTINNVGELRSFQQILHGRASPVSSSSPSVSTESSAENGREQVIRCESPLPDSIRKRKEDDSFESAIKPCTPKAFRFFMEQHIENVIKQCEARRNRLMQLEKEMAKATLPEKWKSQMLKLLAQKESRYLRCKRQKLNKSMFEKIKTIGVGAFGEVCLVRKKDTDSLYAMKILRKTDVIKLNQAAHVKAERDILAEANSEWIVKLFYSFQDKQNLFFIMEYIPGGDMMSLLIKKGIFEQDLARFYIAELVCAIESVHRLGFIHRDIKPDNILIDLKGHMKLTDFGLCTGLRWTHDKRYYTGQEDTSHAGHHTRQDSFDLLREENPRFEQKLLNYRSGKKRNEAHSLVGTSNYMAPEVLLYSGHNQLCDWWSVGVILYEMVVGCPPFYADNPRKTQEKVIHWREHLRIPEGPGRPKLSEEVKDLILQLCCDQEDRLGRNGGAAEIKRHPFFKGIDFNPLRLSKAPYIPQILSPTDTSHFDPVESRENSTNQIEEILKPFDKQRHSNGSNPAFFEFTFRHFFDMDPSGCPILRQSTRPSLPAVFEASGPTTSINGQNGSVQNESETGAMLTMTSSNGDSHLMSHESELSMYV